MNEGWTVFYDYGLYAEIDDEVFFFKSLDEMMEFLAR